MKAYILTLMASALIVTVSSVILPSGSIKKYARLASSVMISLSVITPFKGILNMDGIFDSVEFHEEVMTKEDAEKIYNENLKNELENSLEEELSEYGRAYVMLDENFAVSYIEIYADKELDEEEMEEIRKKYSPERLEVLYGDY